MKAIVWMVIFSFLQARSVYDLMHNLDCGLFLFWLFKDLGFLQEENDHLQMKS